MLLFYVIFSYLFIIGTFVGRDEKFDLPMVTLICLSPIIFPFYLGIWSEEILQSIKKS